MTKARAILIADDYGLGERHDAAIRSLLARGAIDATSVLVETCSKASAEALLDCIGTKRIGLHFNLTYGAQGGPTPRAAIWFCSKAYSVWEHVELKPRSTDN